MELAAEELVTSRESLRFTARCLRERLRRHEDDPEDDRSNRIHARRSELLRDVTVQRAIAFDEKDDVAFVRVERNAGGRVDVERASHRPLNVLRVVLLALLD